MDATGIEGYPSVHGDYQSATLLVEWYGNRPRAHDVSPNSPPQIVLYANKLASDKVFPILESVGSFRKHLYRRTFPINYTLHKSSK